ncbi:hypothetical protein GCM10007874_01120 [Labrys miyagiensis]|uniref:Tetratricopeptide repeat protein n=1 Tax=Labrys miyagiensis TaxID=346912 RepID=A0ABQ6CFU7_9HYPH|nr:tetratricopeptide repeat protein [Labrys miyagiensis]GLS17097.1 hypothetical protein GCM10007874_01120 [Labrys miyagiensis]
MAAEAKLKTAIDHHREGRLDEAEAGYRKVLARDKHDFNALNLLGTLLLQRESYAEAEKLLLRALEINPRSADAQMRLGLANRGLGDTRRAEYCFRSALDIDPKLADAHFNYAGLLASLGRGDEALRGYLACIEADPRHAEAHLNLGYLLLENERFEPAAAHFQQALQLRPSEPALMGLGHAAKGGGQLDEARQIFAKALELNPANEVAKKNLAELAS